jgi:hypothetical protein
MRNLPYLLLALSLVLSACGTSIYADPGDGLTLTPGTPVAVLESVSPTATIVWFPATATWTPFPTVQPSVTPQPFPGLGPQVYQDDFSDLGSWSLAKPASTGGNSIILDRSSLTLAINLPPAALYSLNTRLALKNFYAEMTVSVNRCFGPDVYGMLFRAASADYTYRFLLNCSGKARVEQTRAGRNLPLMQWEDSGDIPSGAPGLVKMGVWTAGAEMRFFLNGRYQFTVIDPVFKNGSLGVYSSATSPGGMNINFSNLTVNSVDYLSPTPTVTPSKTPTSTRTLRPVP